MSNVNIDNLFSEYVLKEFKALALLANYARTIISFLTM